jgi:lysophospholipase L1-like esterase
LSCKKWTGFGLVGVVLVTATYFFFRSHREPVIDAHTWTRQLVIQATLNRFPDPIIVLGDSIVEASTLPRSLCGHAIINAGIGGASTASKLGTMLEKSLGGKRAALIIVSLGTNDAAASRSQQTFGSNYSNLLKQLSGLAPYTVVMAIPPVENEGTISANSILPDVAKAAATINDYNSFLPDIAKAAGATFAALPSMPAPHTFDGVHLNAAGYDIWDKTILLEAATICASK